MTKKLSTESWWASFWYVKPLQIIVQIRIFLIINKIFENFEPPIYNTVIQ